MSTSPDVHLLSGSYALDAVNAEEAAAVETEMARSEDFRGEIGELTDTAVMLGLAVRAETPPPALRARLLDLIGETPQLQAEPRPEEAQAVLTTLPTGSHVAPARRRGRMRRRPAVLLSLAAVAVLLFGGGLAVDRIVTQPQSDYAAVATAPDAQPHTGAVPGGGTFTVSWSKQLNETAVVLNGVEHPDGTTLQLWRLNDHNVAVSAGLYEPRAGENSVVVKGALTHGEKFAVTIEPAGGSPKPTSPAMVLVKA